MVVNDVLDALVLGAMCSVLGALVLGALVLRAPVLGARLPVRQQPHV